VAVYRRNTRTRYVLAVLVLAALTLVTIDARSSGTGFTSDIRAKAHDVFSPLQRVTHDALQPIGNFLSGAVDYGSLKRQNQQLRQQVASLENQAIQSDAEDAAAQQLLAQEHLKFLGNIKTVTAQVINTGSSNFEDALTIGVGTASGVAVGEPVVAAGGLVGTVASAGKSTSTVLLMTDPTFVVGVRLDPANVGSAFGMGLTAPLRVTVDTTNKNPPVLKKGQAVVTSGLSLERFPSNIPVGKVASYSFPAGATEPTITLDPLVNLNQLDYLQVLLWLPS
jgi:rod shape-determining protein MreC